MTAHIPMFLTEAECEIIRSIRTREASRVSIRSMAKQAAAEAGIPLDDLLGPCRRAHLCRIREVVYGAARRQGYSLSRIGRVFGRDHTTIMAGLRNLERRSQP